jgi:RNA polymerase sigma-70 factor (ECF subfamily)
MRLMDDIDPPPEDDPVNHGPDTGDMFMSNEPTVELIVRARTGDDRALEALLQRCLPRLKRWAHGRLPRHVRSYMETDDLVQDALLHVIRRLDTFEPRHVGAMQAYLRESVKNQIRDELRKFARRPEPQELVEDYPSTDRSPEEQALEMESYERYRAALGRLRAKERELVIGRIELDWTHQECADRFGFSNSDAARMATNRAIRHLTRAFQE